MFGWLIDKVQGFFGGGSKGRIEKSKQKSLPEHVKELESRIENEEKVTEKELLALEERVNKEHEMKTYEKKLITLRIKILDISASKQKDLLASLEELEEKSNLKAYVYEQYIKMLDVKAKKDITDEEFHQDLEKLFEMGGRVASVESLRQVAALMDGKVDIWIKTISLDQVLGTLPIPGGIDDFVISGITRAYSAYIAKSLPFVSVTDNIGSFAHQAIDGATWIVSIPLVESFLDWLIEPNESFYNETMNKLKKQITDLEQKYNLWDQVLETLNDMVQKDKWYIKRFIQRGMKKAWLYDDLEKIDKPKAGTKKSDASSTPWAWKNAHKKESPQSSGNA